MHRYFRFRGHFRLVAALLVAGLGKAGASLRHCTRRGRKNSLARYALALCLDGSPGAYYFSAGAENSKFLLHLEGGGSCAFVDGGDGPRQGDDFERQHSCMTTSKGPLGSTDGDPEELDLCGGPGLCRDGFSRHPQRNPLLHDWNHVYVRYCDGGYFTANHSASGLHFRGAEILSSVLDDLSRQHGMHMATDIVISGCSAGGIAVWANVDWVSQHPAVPKAARFSGFPIEGFYLDDTLWEPGPYRGHRMEGIGVFAFIKKSVFQVHRPTTLSPECLLHHSERPYLCLIASQGADFIKSQLFFWQSKFDQDILAWQPNYGQYGQDIGICLPPDGGSDDASRIESQCANRIGARMSAALRGLWERKPNIAGFLDACYHHCPTVPSGIQIEGASPTQAFAAWYGGGQRIWNVDHHWERQTCWPSFWSGVSMPDVSWPPWFSRIESDWPPVVLYA